MKKIFTLLLATVLSFSAYSTHLMGGQVTATYLSSDSNGSHYIVNLDAYRDTFGVSMSLIQQLDIYELDSSFNYTFLFSQTISFDTTSGTSMSSMSSVYGVEIYHFSDSIVLADGNYIIKWSDCCRNGAIINMSAPLSESMTFATALFVDAANPNSTPTFLSDPVTYLPINTFWQYNPLPFDPDGDSLVWSLSVPYSGGSSAIPDSVSGYEYLSDTLYSNSSTPFSIDSITGQVSWNAKMVGNFVVSFAIQEFRNGVFIGAMNRDMQFVVIPDSTNAMPMISNINNVPTNSIGYPYVKIMPGQNYQLHLLASDADVNDVVDMDAFGESFNQTTSLSTFNVLPTGNGNEIEGTFSWNPSTDDVRSFPYLVVFRTSDNIFYFDETIQFEVTNNATSLESVDGMVFSNIYPNPTNNRVFIPVVLEESKKMSIEIYNVLGTKMSQSTINLGVGSHLIMKDVNLSSAQYIILIKDENGMILNSQHLQIVK